MATMVQQVCWCGKKFEAREADVKRGWGKSCCKKHAAKARGRKQHAVSVYDKHVEEERIHHAGMEGLPHDWSPF